MKNFVITGLTALTIGVATLSAAHAADTVTADQKLEAFREGKSGVYGRSPVADIGNVISRGSDRTWDGKTQDDPSHFQGKGVEGRYGGTVTGTNKSSWPINGANGKTWDGKTQDDPSHFRNGAGVYGRSSVYDIGNPSAHREKPAK